MPYYNETGDRDFCEHYIPGETLIHTICDKCTKCCNCKRMPTGRELREQAAEVFANFQAAIDGLKETVAKIPPPRREPPIHTDEELLPIVRRVRR
jgi:hypothetical protein